MNSHPLHALVRPEVRPLPAYNAGLSSDAVRARYGATRIARLASNENPYGPSPAVVRALADSAAQLACYPDAQCTALRQAIAAGTGVAEDCLVFGNGSEDILQMLCQAFLSPGEQVLTQSPAFGLHEIYPRMMGAHMQLLALTPQLEMDLDAWCAALAQGPKLVLLANPSNPVGCMWTAAQFAQLLAATPRHSLLVVDEAYYEYACLSPDYPDVLQLLRAHDGPWMVLRTFSKAWGLAGLRVGYGMASDKLLVQALDKVRTPFNVNQLAQLAALAAWGDPAYMQQSVQRTVNERERMRARLQQLSAPGQPLAGMRMAPSAANFLFLDLGRPNAPVHQALLAQGVITKAWNEPGYGQFLRVSIGSQEDNDYLLAALVQAMAPVAQQPAALAEAAL